MQHESGTSPGSPPYAQGRLRANPGRPSTSCEADDASQPGRALRLAGELVVLRLILLLARVCGTVRLPRMSRA